MNTIVSATSRANPRSEVLQHLREEFTGAGMSGVTKHAGGRSGFHDTSGVHEYDRVGDLACESEIGSATAPSRGIHGCGDERGHQARWRAIRIPRYVRRP